MKLYDSAIAPNPRRVRIYLAEKGINVPIEQVDIAKGVNRQPPFLAKNPFGGVPVLELDDGTCIAESIAICRYFEETNPKPALFGEGAKGRAVVEMWQRRMELGLLSLAAGAFQHTSEFFKGRIKQVPDWGALCKENALARMQWLDGELASRKFIAGDQYTVADITALVAIDFGRASQIRVAPEQKNLVRWHQEVSSRPSAKA
jgi:glutathione S-transferase